MARTSEYDAAPMKSSESESPAQSGGPTRSRSPLLKRARALGVRARRLGFLNRPVTALVRSLSRGRPPAWAVKHLPRVGLVESALPNGRLLRLSSRGDDWVSNQVFWHGWAGDEPETTRVFFSLAERSEFTIDVGAHVGLYALLAAHATPAGRVLALEPVPATLQRLRRNVALNGLENVECLGVAASDASGEATMQVPKDSLIPCSAGLSSEAFRSWADAYSAIIVKTETLDRLVEARGFRRVDLLKMDTEGTEASILRGARRVLQEHRPSIICEVLEGAHSAAALEALLVPLGYRFELLTPDGLLPRERIEPHPVYWNFLCTAR